MNLVRPCLLVSIAFIGVFSLQADQVILKNGDRASGTVVKKDGKTLTLNSSHFGLITIPWDQVQEIRTDSPVTVVLPSGEAVLGTVNTKDAKVEVASGARQQTVAIPEVVTIRNPAEQAAFERLLRPSWGQLWAGVASFGLAGTQGNAETRTLTAGVTAARVTNRDKTTLYFNAISASALLNGTDASTARAVRGGVGYSHNVSERLFVNGFNDYEFDRFQNLDLRVVLGGGLGYIAWKGEKGRLDVLGGGAYNRESFGAFPPQPAFKRNSAEAYAGDDFAYKLSSVTALTQSLRFFPNLSNTGEYRMNFDIGATTKLFKWINWTVAVSDRYLSNPVIGRKQNDLLYTTGVGFSFAK